MADYHLVPKSDQAETWIAVDWRAMKITTVRSAVLSVLFFSGLAHMTGAPTDRSPTYAREVSRILQKHCVACHQPGGVGPFSLTNYTEASAFAREIRLATQS